MSPNTAGITAPKPTRPTYLWASDTDADRFWFLNSEYRRLAAKGPRQSTADMDRVARIDSEMRRINRRNAR